MGAWVDESVPVTLPRVRKTEVVSRARKAETCNDGYKGVQGESALLGFEGKPRLEALISMLHKVVE